MGTLITLDDAFKQELGVHSYAHEFVDTKKAEISTDIFGSIHNQDEGKKIFSEALTSGFTGILNLAESGTGKSTLTDGLIEAMKKLDAGEEIHGEHVQPIIDLHKKIMTRNRFDTAAFWDPKDKGKARIIDISTQTTPEIKETLETISEIPSANSPYKHFSKGIEDILDNIQNKLNAAIDTELVTYFAQETYRQFENDLNKGLEIVDIKKRDITYTLSMEDRELIFNIKYINDTVKERYIKKEEREREEIDDINEQKREGKAFVLPEKYKNMTRFDEGISRIEYLSNYGNTILEQTFQNCQITLPRWGFVEYFDIWDSIFNREDNTQDETEQRLSLFNEYQDYRNQYKFNASSYIDLALKNKSKTNKVTQSELEKQVQEIFQTEINGLCKLAQITENEDLMLWAKDVKTYVLEKSNMERINKQVRTYVSNKRNDIEDVISSLRPGSITPIQIMLPQGRHKYTLREVIKPSDIDLASYHNGVRISIISETDYSQLYGYVESLSSPEYEGDDVPIHDRIVPGKLATSDIVIVDDVLGKIIREDSVRSALYTFLEKGTVVTLGDLCSAEMKSNCLMIGNDTSNPFFVEHYRNGPPIFDEGMSRRFIINKLPSTVSNKVKNREGYPSIFRQLLEKSEKYKNLNITAEGVDMFLQYLSRNKVEDKLPMKIGVIKNEEFAQLLKYVRENNISEVRKEDIIAFAIKQDEEINELETDFIKEFKVKDNPTKDIDRKVGNVNAMYVLQTPKGNMGGTSQITANLTHRFGKIESLDVEAQYVDSDYIKGILIADAFFNNHFGPSSLEVKFSFNLTGGKGGDSSSVVQTLGLLSAMGDIPLPQNVYVTGSVDMDGNINPIGAIYEKIRGTYKHHTLLQEGRQEKTPCICYIPKWNAKGFVKALQFDETLVQAIQNNDLQVYYQSNIWEAFEDISGLPKEEYCAKIKTHMEEETKKITEHHKKITEHQFAGTIENIAIAATAMKP